MERVSFWMSIGLLFGLVGCATPQTTITPTVTLSEYNQIQSAMSYSEVIGIIGSSGSEQSRVEVPGTPETVMYAWQNSDGSNMNAMFQDDELVSKAQFGLK
ncbi:hypothetical protein LEP3755_46240 [Leptolyngbya sp. NIES-3755]|nr:hypothetical protein LEP3755_46240 [Leptolyngbya sp. NIES-3755]